MIAYFLSHPIQYFTPFFQDLSKSVDLEVYYYSDSSIRGGFDKGFGQNIRWDIPLLDGYKYIFLKNISYRKSINRKLFDAINLSIPRKVKNKNVSVIIVNGWSYLSDWIVLISAFIYGKEVWMRTETPQHQEELKKGLKQKFKSFLLRKLVFKFLVDRFLYIGTQNRLFYEKNGVNSNRLIYTPYSVDNNKFHKSYNALIESKSRIKEQLGVSTYNKVILFCGKYISQKCPMDLLNAFSILRSENVCLVMVGEGHLRKDIEEFINKNNLSNVILTGFINQSKIAEYYLVADLFVMTSGMGESWGLAVNEAMNFKLPIIVSNTTGCSYDLIKDGQNGFVYTQGDIKDLANKIDFSLNNVSFMATAGNISFDIISKYSIEFSVENINQAYAGRINPQKVFS